MIASNDPDACDVCGCALPVGTKAVQAEVTLTPVVVGAVEQQPAAEDFYVLTLCSVCEQLSPMNVVARSEAKCREPIEVLGLCEAEKMLRAAGRDDDARRCYEAARQGRKAFAVFTADHLTIHSF